MRKAREVRSPMSTRSKPTSLSASFVASHGRPSRAPPTGLSPGAGTASCGGASPPNCAPHNGSIPHRLCPLQTTPRLRAASHGRSPPWLAARRSARSITCTRCAARDPSCGSPPAARVGQPGRFRLWSAPRLPQPRRLSAPWSRRPNRPSANGAGATPWPSRLLAATAAGADRKLVSPPGRGAACCSARPARSAGPPAQPGPQGCDPTKFIIAGHPAQRQVRTRAVQQGQADLGWFDDVAEMERVCDRYKGKWRARCSSLRQHTQWPASGPSNKELFT
jgi:hypothetical protein